MAVSYSAVCVKALRANSFRSAGVVEPTNGVEGSAVEAIMQL